MNDSSPLLEVKDLEFSFTVGGGLLVGGQRRVKVVDRVSFSLARGETLGLVGESGSGKTTVARAILRALRPSGGSVRLNVGGESHDLARLSERRLRPLRRHMQMVFQDPHSSLNARMTARDIIAEPLQCLGGALSRAEIDERVREIAGKCRLNLEHLRRFPHAFSGGQRQRIGIARALILYPEIVVCDESVAALDVSTQADILNLLAELQDEMGTSYLFISHDLAVVAHLSDRVAVLYAGALMELASAKKIFAAPRHPYTRVLMSAIPSIEKSHQFRPIKLPGEIPSPGALPSGCRFNTRCPRVRDRCRIEVPVWRELENNHRIACHFPEETS